MPAILFITIIALFSTLNQDAYGHSLGKEDNSLEIQSKNRVKQYLEKLKLIKSLLDNVPLTIDEEVQSALATTSHLNGQCRHQASYKLNQVKNLSHQNITSCEFRQNLYNITDKLINDGEELVLALYETTIGSAQLFFACFASSSLREFLDCERYDFSFAVIFFLDSIKSAADLILDGVEYPAKTVEFVWSCFRRDVFETTIQNVIVEALQCHQKSY